MTARHIILTLGVLVAGWLALFGDKTPSANIAEPVTRKEQAGSVQTRMTTTANTNASASAGNSTMNSSNRKNEKKSDAEPVILTLIARENLIGNGHAETKSDGF